MHIGTQIVAPEGFDQLVQDVTYYFLKSDKTKPRVLLVHFAVAKAFEKTKAHLLVMNRDRFEAGISDEKIVPLAVQSKLPPWLKEREGIDLSSLDLLHPNLKIPYSSRVGDRLLTIVPALKHLETILTTPDPAAEINRRALSCNPVQHETRFRLRFLTYLLFGCNVWALLPPFHRAGRWPRFDHPNTKFGAPSIAYGARYGYPSSADMAERCVLCYIKYAKVGMTMTEIYRLSMTEQFKCKTMTLDSGMEIYVHPKGDPFPTYWQFKYRILKEFGLEQVQRTLYGDVRHRARLAATKGHFSQEVANLYEKIEADGYFTSERPRGYIEGASLKPLCVVVGSDCLSGTKLGIGFSFGAERSTAYRMMLFSMAVPKAFFCMLFGIPFYEGEWNNEGIPSHFGVDRGPGARQALIADLEKRFPIKEIAPSWSPQSKATIESSHPRNLKMDGQPTYVQSKLTPVQMAKKEILRLIKYNHTADMSDRFDPEGDLAFVPPTPISLWNYYDIRFRNDAQPMSIDEAVRTFLTPVDLSLRDDGVWLEGRRFDSPELEKTGIYGKAARSNQEAPKLQGYLLDLCVRYLWVEVNGRLFLVEAKLRTRGDQETLWTSFEELKQWSDARRKVDSAFGVHQHAAASKYMNRFTEATGKSWDSGVRRTGKVKRDATVLQEEAEAKQHTAARSTSA